MSRLFEPIALRRLDLPNRIMVSPMCQYSAIDGSATPWHYAHLGSLALSGAGFMSVEATAVNAQGRITPGCLGLYSDANEAALAPIVAMIRHSSPVKVAIQLAHADRKGSSNVSSLGGKQIGIDAGGWKAVAPSALSHGEGEALPHALSG